MAAEYKGFTVLDTVGRRPDMSLDISWRCETLFDYWLIEQGLTSPPTQYRLTVSQFYRSKDPTSSIKVLKEKKRYKSKENPRKSRQHQIQQHNKETYV